MRRSLVAVVVGLLLFLGGQESFAGPRARVAILPIVVHTLEHKGYLQAGLADMLGSRLGRVPGVAVIRLQGEDQATTDLEAAQNSAREAGAEFVLFGSFTQFGEGASLDLQCAPVSAEDEVGSRSIFIQSGTLGEIIPQLDQVAEKVGRHLAAGGAAPGAASESLPAVGAAAPGAGSTTSGEQFQDALSELDALRGRVDALEQRVFSPPVELLPGDDLRSGGDVIESDPELHSDLR
jgi:TolB-like protein